MPWSTFTVTPSGCQVNDHVPSTYTIGWERMRRLHISNYLGFAFEGMMCAASLTLGGLLEEFPDLKICNFESGGSPAAMGLLHARPCLRRGATVRSLQHRAE